MSSEKLFSFSRYSNFFISVFPSFFPAGHCFIGWLKMNLTIHDVINCLNKELDHIFCSLLRLCQFIGYYIRKKYMEKSCRKCASKASPRWYTAQNSHCIQEILLKITYFEKGLSKTLKKVYFSFQTQSLLMEKIR